MRNNNQIHEFENMFRNDPNNPEFVDIMTAISLNPKMFDEDMIGAIKMDMQEYSLGNLPLKEKKELKDKYYGEVVLGNSEDLGCNIGLSKIDLTKNVLISGSPGMGKTNLITLLIIQILSK